MKHAIRSIWASVMAQRERRRLMIEKEGIFGALPRQKGFVLIMVLLICAMLITVSGEFLINAQNNISYMSEFKGETQSVELAKAGIEIAKYILEADKTGKTGSILQGYNTPSSADSYKDIWAAEFPEIPLENGSVKIVIRDEQAKINASILANDVGETPYYHIARRLLQSMGFLPDICDSIRDWIDPDSNKAPYGAETFDYYSTLPKPRAAKNAPLDSIDELLMVKGITPQIYYGLGGGNMALERDLVPDNMFTSPLSLDQSKDQNTATDLSSIKIGKEKSRALADYFRAHGSSDFNSPLNKINLNTASFRVLSALTEKMTDANVTELIRTRISRPFVNVGDATKILGIGDDPISQYLTVSSSVFSITATGKCGGQYVTICAVYNRADKRYFYYGIQ